MALVAESKSDPQIGTGIVTAIFRSKLGHNVLSLYAGQTAMYLAPLITVPYLARVLGQQEWGRFSFAYSLSLELALLLDFGSFLTANRAVARRRHDPGALSVTIGAVLISKGILMIAAGALAAIAFTRVPSLHESAGLFWFAAAAGVTQGLNFSWYLHGMERMSLAVVLDLGGRFLVAGAMVALVRSSADAWVFFALQTVANLLIAGTGFIYAYRRNRFAWPGVNSVIEVFREGASAFLSRCGFGVFTGLNTFVLGLYANPIAVGFYAGAERIARVAAVVPAPISQALFPRISHLSMRESPGLPRLRKIGGAATILAGGLASIAMYLVSPLAIRILLGAGYDPSAVILKILSPLPFLFACNQVLVYQHLLPDGEVHFVGLTLAATTILVLAVVTVAGWAARPNVMAAAADVAEILALACLAARVAYKRSLSAAH